MTTARPLAVLSFSKKNIYVILMQSKTKWTKVPYTFYNFPLFLSKRSKSCLGSRSGSVSPGCRCGSGKMMPVRPDPDPQQWETLHKKWKSFRKVYKVNWNVPLKVHICLMNDGIKLMMRRLRLSAEVTLLPTGRNFGCITQKGPRRDVSDRTLPLPIVSRIFSNERKSAYFQAEFSYILFSM